MSWEGAKCLPACRSLSVALACILARREDVRSPRFQFPSGPAHRPQIRLLRPCGIVVRFNVLPAERALWSHGSSAPYSSHSFAVSVIARRHGVRSLLRPLLARDFSAFAEAVGFAAPVEVSAGVADDPCEETKKIPERDRASRTLLLEGRELFLQPTSH